jgi:hypothetical protein
MYLFLVKQVESDSKNLDFRSNGLDKAVSIKPIGKIKIGGVVLLQIEDKNGNSREDLYFSSELIDSSGDFKVGQSQDGKWRFKADGRVHDDKVALDRDIPVSSLRKIYQYDKVKTSSNAEYMDDVLPRQFASKTVVLVSVGGMDRKYFDETGEEISQGHKVYRQNASGISGVSIFPIYQDILKSSFDFPKEVKSVRSFEDFLAKGKSNYIWNDSKSMVMRKDNISSGLYLHHIKNDKAYTGKNDIEYSNFSSISIKLGADKNIINIQFAESNKEILNDIFDEVVRNILEINKTGQQNDNTMPFVYEIYDAFVQRGFKIESPEMKTEVERAINKVKLSWGNKIPDELVKYQIYNNEDGFNYDHVSPGPRRHYSEPPVFPSQNDSGDKPKRRSSRRR